MKKNNTKRALLLSVLSLLMCCTMLVGSTFAWFTDSVASKNSIITSGNLDVVLEYKTNWNDEWKEVTADAPIFKEGALYEPGYTEVVFLRVANAGSLALKYNLNVNIYNETPSINVGGAEFKLSDYLQVGVYRMDEYNGEHQYANTLFPILFGSRETALSNVTLGKLETSVLVQDAPVEAGDKTSQVVALVLTMPTTVGNEANHRADATAPTIELGITLTATQYTATFESDSFDNQYDKDAAYVALPRANVNKLPEEVKVTEFLLGDAGREVTLDTAYTFTQTETDETIANSPYRYWHADFVVSFDREVAPNAIGLAGSYEMYQNGEWLGILVDDPIPANTPIRLLALGSDYAWTYEDICKFVNVFKCGAFLNDDSAKGTTMTVDLVVYEAEEGETYVADEKGAHVVSTVKYTFE